MDTPTPTITPDTTDPLGGSMLVTVTRTAEILGVGRTTIYALMDSGQLESCKVGSRRLIPADAIRTYVARLRDAA